MFIFVKEHSTTIRFPSMCSIHCLFGIPTDILHGLIWSAFPRIYYSVNFGSFPRIFGKYINISFPGNFEPTSTQYLTVANQQILKYVHILSLHKNIKDAKIC